MSFTVDYLQLSRNNQNDGDYTGRRFEEGVALQFSA